jgi:hypothetical protein
MVRRPTMARNLMIPEMASIIFESEFIITHPSPIFLRSALSRGLVLLALL